MTVDDEVGRESGGATAVSDARTSTADTTPSTKKGEKKASPLHAGRGGDSRLQDGIFRGITIAASAIVVTIVALIAIILTVQGWQALNLNKANFLLSGEWATGGYRGDPESFRFGIYDLFIVTIMSSLVALIIAVPIAVGIAVFLVQYARKELSRPLSTVIDLLAAVPSIIYGLWGALVLAPFLTPLANWLIENLGWIPLFSKGNIDIVGKTVFTASIVLAVMILPIITSMARETIRQTPGLHQEAALALGATRWEKIRMTCFPYAKSGIIAGAMLALGRALGETIAVLMILGASPAATPENPTMTNYSLFDGGYTFASKIAAGAAEFNDPIPTGAYIAAGLVLFILTFVVNAIARYFAGGKVNG